MSASPTKKSRDLKNSKPRAAHGSRPRVPPRQVHPMDAWEFMEEYHVRDAPRSVSPSKRRPVQPQPRGVISDNWMAAGLEECLVGCMHVDAVEAFHPTDLRRVGRDVAIPIARSPPSLTSKSAVISTSTASTTTAASTAATTTATAGTHRERLLVHEWMGEEAGVSTGANVQLQDPEAETCARVGSPKFVVLVLGSGILVAVMLTVMILSAQDSRSSPRMLNMTLLTALMLPPPLLTNSPFSHLPSPPYSWIPYPPNSMVPLEELSAEPVPPWVTPPRAPRPPRPPNPPLSPLSPMAALALLPEKHTLSTCGRTFWGEYFPVPVMRQSMARDQAAHEGEGDVATATGQWKVLAADAARRQQVVDAVQHAWQGYKTYAFGYDELRPLSRRGMNNFGGFGTTIVDSLGTLWLMDLTTEYYEARTWVQESLRFDDKDVYVSVFEITIRILGGLLSAFDMTGDPLYRDKAADLGTRLLQAFESPSGIPYHKLNLMTGVGVYKRISIGASQSAEMVASLAEVGSLQMEFNALTRVTGLPKFERAATRAWELLLTVRPQLADSLLPVHLNPAEMVWGSDRAVSFGANGDSFYEYLLKVWIQRGQRPEYDVLRQTWTNTMNDMIRLLQKQSMPSGFNFIASRYYNTIHREMNHLACFVPGMLALGAGLLNRSNQLYNYTESAQAVLETCWQMYRLSPSGLAPESVYFPAAKGDQDIDFMTNPANFLRPETLESMFVMYRRTGDDKYRQQAWSIFEAFETQAKVSSGGYSGLVDINANPAQKDDTMQSFFLAETLKYLFLIFSDSSKVPMDVWVFNTEAHPLQIHCDTP